MIRIAVDAMGADLGPEEIVAGAREAASDAIEPILFGAAGLDPGGLELVETSGVIEMGDSPVEAVRANPDSSLVAACRAVGEGRADAVVSAGNTGAMLAACLFELRRIPGVLRPAIAVPIPSRRGPSVLIDAGANAEARPEHLLQFATMGSVFAEEILELPNPEVRLLSIGEEPEKGNPLTLEAHALLTESGLNFQGNVESRLLLEGAADVVVCDGFTGNVCLKLIEGTIATLLDAFRAEIVSSPARPARRPADPARGPPAARPARSRHLRRRVPPGAQGDRRGGARKLQSAGDRERDRARCEGCRAPRGGAACRAPAGRRGSIGALYDPNP